MAMMAMARAITESLPVGNEAGIGQGGKAGQTTVDANAFSKSLAAAGGVAGRPYAGAGTGTNAGAGAPVRGQKDLIGWDSGNGASEASGNLSQASLAGWTNPSKEGAKAGTAGVAVSSHIGQQQISEDVQAAGDPFRTNVSNAGEVDAKSLGAAAALQQGAREASASEATSGVENARSAAATVSAATAGAGATAQVASAKVAVVEDPSAAPVVAGGPASLLKNGCLGTNEMERNALNPVAATVASVPPLTASPAPGDELGTETTTPSASVAAGSSAGNGNDHLAAQTRTAVTGTETSLVERGIAASGARSNYALAQGTENGRRVKAGDRTVGARVLTVDSGKRGPATETAQDQQGTLVAAKASGSGKSHALAEPSAALNSAAARPANAGTEVADRTASSISPTASVAGNVGAADPHEATAIGVTTGTATPAGIVSAGAESPIAGIGPSGVTQAARQVTPAAVSNGNSLAGKPLRESASVSGPLKKQADGAGKRIVPATSLNALGGLEAPASASTGDGSSLVPVTGVVIPPENAGVRASAEAETSLAGVDGARTTPGLRQGGANPQGSAVAVKAKGGNGARRSGGTVDASAAEAAAPARQAGSVALDAAGSPPGKAVADQGKAQDGQPATGAGSNIAASASSGANAHAAPVSGWNGVVTSAPARAEVVAVTPAGSGASLHASSPTSAAASGVGAGSGIESTGLATGLAGSGQGHTTLQATPTVLEVGVPGGSHGWLKIRAELGEGGAVHATVSSGTQAGQETLRKEIPAMSAYLESEHVPVSLQMVHAAASTGGSTLPASTSDGLASGLAFGSGEGAGGQGGANPDQARGDAATVGGGTTGSGDASDRADGRQPENALGFPDGVSAAVRSTESDWSPLGYGGVSLTTGGSWVNVIA